MRGGGGEERGGGGGGGGENETCQSAVEVYDTSL